LDTLNGAWIESVQGKREEMFGVKEELEEKPKKPTKKKTNIRKRKVKKKSG